MIFYTNFFLTAMTFILLHCISFNCSLYISLTYYLLSKIKIITCFVFLGFFFLFVKLRVHSQYNNHNHCHLLSRTENIYNVTSKVFSNKLVQFGDKGM